MELEVPAQQKAFLSQVTDAGLLMPLGRQGLFARSALFEEIAAGVGRLVDRLGSGQNPMKLTFPPVIPLQLANASGALSSFPNLLGLVYTFTGDDKQHAQLLSNLEDGRELSDILEPTSLALVTAACHPLYPLLRGVLPEGGCYADVLGQCFRFEPSNDPARLLSFRQRELVCLGAPAAVARQYESWVTGAEELLQGLGLAASSAAASDPFFGRAGRLLADAQRSKNLKTEIVVKFYDQEGGTAIASCNLHEDHFCRSFDIRTPDGSVAHSACVGFGLERITLALVHTHGVDIDGWPLALRDRLTL